MRKGLSYHGRRNTVNNGASLAFNFLNGQGLDPRITFTRASNATQFNSAGTLVYAPHNLILDSEDWSTASWNRLNCTFSYNAATAPNGTLTADLLIPNNGSTIGRTTQSVSTLPDLISCVLSVYVKASGLTNVIVQVVDKSNTTQSSQTLNLSTGALSGSIDAGTITTVTDVGNGWYRLSFAITSISSGATTPVWTIRCSSTGNGTDGILLWGAQLNVGSLQSYNQTTSSAYYGPRLDYNPATLAAQGLLIEEQRTNLLLRSAEFSNPYWLLSRATISADVVSAPDGTTTADKLVEDTTVANTHYVYANNVSVTAATTYTFTVFLKAAERTFASIDIADGTGANGGAVGINLTSGTIGAPFARGTGSNVAATISTINNGWYRVSITAQLGAAATTCDCAIYTATSLLTSGYPATNGDGVSGIYVWGAQLEAGAFPTSYIPTTTTALTRSADDARVNTLAPWYNQSAGTLFVERIRGPLDATAAKRYVNISDGSSGTNVAFQKIQTSAGGSTAVSYVAGVPDFAPNPAGVSADGAIVKTALAIDNTGKAMSRDGGTVSTSAVLPALSGMTTMFIGGNGNLPFNCDTWIRRITYYPRKLSSAELQALTV